MRKILFKMRYSTGYEEFIIFSALVLVLISGGLVVLIANVWLSLLFTIPLILFLILAVCFAVHTLLCEFFLRNRINSIFIVKHYIGGNVLSQRAKNIQNCVSGKFDGVVYDLLQSLNPGTYYTVTHDKIIEKMKNCNLSNVSIEMDCKNVKKSNLKLEKRNILKNCKECKNCKKEKCSFKKPECATMHAVRIIVS